VDDCDLYAEGSNPVMSREERLGYHDVPANRAAVAGYVERLQKADALVFCFPTWCFGLPAMLKGFFDRLFMPGVAFDISDPANVKPMLTWTSSSWGGKAARRCRRSSRASEPSRASSRRRE
jgi:putative NADPH-quinone reductase